VDKASICQPAQEPFHDMRIDAFEPFGMQRLGGGDDVTVTEVGGKFVVSIRKSRDCAGPR